MTVEAMTMETMETAEAVDDLKAVVVKGTEKNVLVIEGQTNLIEEEVILGGVVIETKDNRKFKI
jgi:hypothetical protein